MAIPIEECDYLENDPPIPGQNFVVMSFVSPEKVLPRKDLHLVQHFLHHLLSDPLKMKQLQETKPTYDQVVDLFEGYRITDEDRVNRLFDEANDFQTSVRGIKIRGVYDTEKEATIRSKVLERKDRYHHTYVGQVGFWLPWDPRPDSIEKEEYGNEQLNQLMKSKKENAQMREEVFTKDTVQEMEKKRQKMLEEAKQKETDLNTLVAKNKEQRDNADVRYQEEKQRKLNQATDEANKVKEQQQAVQSGQSGQSGQSVQNTKNKKKKKAKSKSKSKKNGEVGPLDTSSFINKVPVEEAKEQIKQLRELADKKDTRFAEVTKENEDGMIEMERNGGSVLNPESDKNIFEQEDPWLARKREQKQSEDLKLDTIQNVL